MDRGQTRLAPTTTFDFSVDLSAVGPLANPHHGRNNQRFEFTQMLASTQFLLRARLRTNVSLE